MSSIPNPSSSSVDLCDEINSEGLLRRSKPQCRCRHTEQEGYGETLGQS